MNREEWIQNQPRFIQLVENALAMLNAESDALYLELYGEEPKRCQRCNRIMVPRRIWNHIPSSQRYSGFESTGNGKEGNSCWITSRRASTLPEREVSRLRGLVGYNPDSKERNIG